MLQAVPARLLASSFDRQARDLCKQAYASLMGQVVNLTSSLLLRARCTSLPWLVAQEALYQRSPWPFCQHEPSTTLPLARYSLI